MTTTYWRNKLYFGDNLDILRENVADVSQYTMTRNLAPFTALMKEEHLECR